MDYFPINPNKSLNGTSHHPIMPLQKLRDVSIKCSLCPQIKMQLYMQYIYIVTYAKLILFVGNSRLRKCFKEKVSAKKSFHIYIYSYIFIYIYIVYVSLYILYIPKMRVSSP